MYALIVNGVVVKYPYPVTDARRDNPNVSFPAFPDDAALAAVNALRVDPAPAPPVTPVQVAVQTLPELDGGRWVQRWMVRDKTADELAAEAQALQDSIVSATEQRLDAFARTRGYDDIKSASDYAGCSVPQFSIEGQYCKDKRAETWAKCYEILAEVQAGTRPVPSGYDDIEPDLPALVWPT